VDDERLDGPFMPLASELHDVPFQRAIMFSTFRWSR
jgi:hypothetical protein